MDATVHNNLRIAEFKAANKTTLAPNGYIGMVPANTQIPIQHDINGTYLMLPENTWLVPPPTLGSRVSLEITGNGMPMVYNCWMGINPLQLYPLGKSGS